MNAQDEAFLIQFSDKAEVVQEFTGNTKEIEEHMHAMKTPTRQTAASSKNGFSNFALRTPLSAH